MAGPTYPAAEQPLTRIAFLACVCLACWAWSLATPLLYDAYGHVALASHSTLETVTAAFFRPHPDIFFRPLGFASYYLDFKWAQYDSVRWHSWNLAIHIVNCALVYLLARQLAFSQFACTLGGTVFAIHGSRFEAVCWTDARFDLLVTFFVLAALLCIGRYADTSRSAWLVAGMLFSLLALLTKEAGFCLPLLILALLPFCGEPQRRKQLRAFWLLLLLSGLVFLYRWWMIGGIGGYQTAGKPNIFHFSAIRTAKALLWRLWAVTFFPVNWVSQTNIWLSLALLVFLVALGVLALKTAAERRRVAAALLFVLAAAIPVQQLLLIGADLADARILYLPLTGVALFWAAVAESYAQQRIYRYFVLAPLLLFNVVALEHNINTWKFVAQTAQQVCRSFGSQLPPGNGTVYVSNVPEKYKGVYFLRNGFADCVQQNSGVPSQRIVQVERTQSANFTWDASALGFVDEPSSLTRK